MLEAIKRGGAGRCYAGCSRCWPVAVLSGLFVVGVGLSRIYLGVHYPSDILAGWAAASAWVMAVYLLAFRGELRPWHPRQR